MVVESLVVEVEDLLVVEDDSMDFATNWSTLTVCPKVVPEQTYYSMVARELVRD